MEAIDKLSELSKSGQTIDGVPVQNPDSLENYRDDGIVVIAIEAPAVWVGISNKLKDMGFHDNHIFPIFEHIAVNGRRWSKIIDSVYAV